MAVKIKHLAVMGVLAFSLAAGREPARGTTFKANVPFEFVVGNQTLSAGTYLIESLPARPSARETTGVVVLQTGDHRVYKTIVTSLSPHHHRPIDGSKLFFTRFQEKHYLNQVWVAGESFVHQLANVPQGSAAHGARPAGEAIPAMVR